MMPANRMDPAVIKPCLPETIAIALFMEQLARRSSTRASWKRA